MTAPFDGPRHRDDLENLVDNLVSNALAPIETGFLLDLLDERTAEGRHSRHAATLRREPDARRHINY